MNIIFYFNEKIFIRIYSIFTLLFRIWFQMNFVQNHTNAINNLQFKHNIEYYAIFNV